MLPSALLAYLHAADVARDVRAVEDGEVVARVYRVDDRRRLVLRAVPIDDLRLRGPFVSDGREPPSRQEGEAIANDSCTDDRKVCTRAHGSKIL
jgi:hypothetical protein